MELGEDQLAELIDSVVDEGEPELTIGPLREAPADLPSLWTQALTSRDPAAFVADLWMPMASRLPRVYEAIRDRLRGVGFLRTEEREASLVYLFADRDSVFAFRGYLPLSEDEIEASGLPGEFLDFYRIHNGWVYFDSGDGGPLPASEWLPLSEVWEEVALKLPPGDGSPDTLLTVFREGSDLAIAYDTSRSPALPMHCRNDGSVDVLLDVWTSVDREIGELLEECDVRPGVTRAGAAARADSRPGAVQRRAELMTRAAERNAVAAHVGGGGIYEQLCDLSLTLARLEKNLGGQREEVVDQYRQALSHFCMSADMGAGVSPGEILDWFGIAHALDDTATAQFVASMPTSIWADDSLAALHARTLFCLYLGDVEHAKEFIDEVLGLTFVEGEEPEIEAEITARLLQALTERDAAGFATARKRAVDELTKGRGQRAALLPWSLRLQGFDAVARTAGIAPSHRR
jgi:hypothetical protein